MANEKTGKSSFRQSCQWRLFWVDLCILNRINYSCFPSDISLSSQGFVVTMDRRPAGMTLHSTNVLLMRYYAEIKGETCSNLPGASSNQRQPRHLLLTNVTSVLAIHLNCVLKSSHESRIR